MMKIVIMRMRGPRSPIAGMTITGADVIMIVCRASGLEPFKRANEKDTFRAILTADFHFEELPEGRKAGWGDRSVHLHDLVRRLLVTDTVLRMTAEQARRHAWVTGALGVVPTTMLPLLPLQLKRYNQLLEQKVIDHLQKLVKSPHFAT